MISQKRRISFRRSNRTVSAPLAVRRQEAARMLGLSITTVDRAIKRGDLRVKRYGTRVMVPTIELQRWANTPPDDEPTE